MAVCMYRENARQDREVAHTDYCNSPNFAELETTASGMGYRHATISEIHASAERSNGAPDLYCWRGGLWVPTA